MNEKELVLRAKNGDQEAFCKLYGMVKDKMYQYAYYKLGNQHDAEDAVSDCVVSAYEQIVNLRKPEAFRSWIFRILYVSCTNYIKLQKKQREMQNIDDVKMLETKETDTTQIREALRQLNEDEKEIVLLAVVAGFKSREIARVVNMTDGSVRSKLSRSLRKMRKFLE